jgi:DNA-binding beta-propeller fold protein YncE
MNLPSLSFGSHFPNNHLCAAAGAIACALLLASPSHAAPSRVAYVIGSLDGSVARVDLETGIVDPSVATTGAVPNRIEASSDGTFALITTSAADAVDLFDVATESITSSVLLPAGTNPWAVEIAGSRYFTTSLLHDRVYEIDPWSAALVDSFPTGIAPEGMCVADGKLYVANTGFDFTNFTYGPGSVTVFDLATNTVVETIPVALNPQECLAAADGFVHVVCTGDFFATTGAVSIIDPGTDTVTATLPIAGFPGNGATDSSGVVYLLVTTTAFTSEVWAYDASSRLFFHDGSNPLLPTVDFLGNPRLGQGGLLYVPDFPLDALLVEDPSLPGTPVPHLVGDGPVDLALIERDGPVAIILSGLRATNLEEGIQLSWRASVESNLSEFAVDRAPAGGAFQRAASDLPVESEAAWLDRAVVPGNTYLYRVGGVDLRGEITWLPAVRIERARGREEIAFVRVSPNPFREQTTIRLHAPPAVRAGVEIFDVGGRRIRSHDLGATGSSVVEWVWDGREASGLEVAPGAYHVRATIGSKVLTQRVLRVR